MIKVCTTCLQLEMGSRLPINLLCICYSKVEESVFKEEFCIFSPTLRNTPALKGKSIGCLCIIYVYASEKSKLLQVNNSQTEYH